MVKKEVKMTEFQKRIYDVVAEKEKVTREEIANELGSKPREVTPPLYALIRDGVAVKDDASGTFAIAAGVEEQEGRVFLVRDEEEEPDFDDYKPEELVTFYGVEGLDHLKRKALISALKSVPGVGAKSEVCILHIFDADVDVRSEPTELMKALEDCGVKKALCGRIVREVFLVEKLYGSYLKEGGDIIIDQRKRRGDRVGRTFIRDTGYEHGRYRDLGDYDDFDYRDRGRGGDERPPQWYSELSERSDRMPLSPKPYATVEPVLDTKGKPVEDPNNPGHYLEKRVIYSDDSNEIRPRSRRSQSRFDDDDDMGRQGAATSPGFEKIEKETESLRAEVAKLKDLLHDHETDKKIGDAVKPLIEKIHSLESRKSGSGSGTVPLSDSQFKAQAERDTIELITETAERNIERMLGPIIEGQTLLQRYQLLQQVIIQERMENLPPGTLLKYLSAGTEEISGDRVQETLKKLKR